jgi:NADH-quinone oxidoreductase subunit A
VDRTAVSCGGTKVPPYEVWVTEYVGRIFRCGISDQRLTMNEYIGIVIAFLIAGGFAAANVGLASVLGPKKPSAVKSEPFECGQVPFALPAGRVSIKFYLTAILFILFDVELVFLYPWAVVYRALGIVGLVEMVIFLGVLMVGFFYAWDNGALDWQ